MEVRPSLIILLVLSALTWAIAGDTWGPDSVGSTPSRPPVVVAGRVSPSPRPSPGGIQYVAVDTLGSVMVNGTVLVGPSPQVVQGALPAGSPIGSMPELPVSLRMSGGGIVQGDANGLVIQGPRAHDAVAGGNPVRVGARAESLGGYSAVSTGDAADLITTTTGLLQTVALGPVGHDSAIAGNPLRLAGRARDRDTAYSSVSADDVADLTTTLNGVLRVVHDAQAQTTGLDVKFVQAEAGGSTDVAVKASSGNLYKLFVSNPNTTDAYLSFYNASTASTTVGSTTQLLCFCVPGGSGASNAGSLELTFDPPITFSTAITYALTTTASGSTAPSSACVINIGYK